MKLDMNLQSFVIWLQLICKKRWSLQWHNVKCIMSIWFYIKVKQKSSIVYLKKKEKFVKICLHRLVHHLGLFNLHRSMTVVFLFHRWHRIPIINGIHCCYLKVKLLFFSIEFKRKIGLEISVDSSLCNEQLNLNDIFQSVSTNTFTNNSSIRKTKKNWRKTKWFLNCSLESTPAVSHPAVTRQYPSSSSSSTTMSHTLTVQIFTFISFNNFVFIRLFRLV